MALSKDDLSKIGKLINTRFDMFEAKWDKKFGEHQIGNDRQFGIVNNRLDVVVKKLDQIIKTENEDIMAVFNDLQGVKTRLKKSGI